MDKKNLFTDARITRFFLAFSTLTYLAFGLFHIDKFVTADEHFWVQERIGNYWKAVANHKWSKTYINDKPGITLAYVSGIPAMLEQSELAKDLSLTMPKVPNDPKGFGAKYAQYRLPLVIFSGLFSLFFFWVLCKLTKDRWVALWATLLILFSPILLGISQIVNPDALLWSFSAASFFSWLAFLKTEEKKLAFFSSLFLGLSLLSKYTSVIFMPFFFLITAAHYFSNFSNWEKESVDISKKVLKTSYSYLAVLVGSLAVFALLLPASFTKDGVFLKGTIGYPGIGPLLWPILFVQLLIIFDAKFFKSKVCAYITSKTVFLWEKYARYLYLPAVLIFGLVLYNWIGSQKLLNVNTLGFSDKQDTMYDATGASKLQKILAEFFPLVFSLTPLVLFSLIYLWIKSLFTKTRYFLETFCVTAFMLIFFAALIRKNVMATIRYGIMIYPLLALPAAVGIREFLSVKKLRFINDYAATAVIIITGLSSLWLIKPFYFNYANFLLPKESTITTAWGYGGYEAAKYISSLPNSKNLTVWSDYYGVCEFLKVKECIDSDYTLDDPSIKVDYYVLTLRGRQRYEAFHLYKSWLLKTPGFREDFVKAYDYYPAENPAWKLLIDGHQLNSVRVFKAQD